MKSRMTLLINCHGYSVSLYFPLVALISMLKRLYGTAKTHKFNDFDEVKVEKTKFKPIVDQAGTETYDAEKLVSEYLKPLAFNEYKINDCLKFPDLIKALPLYRKMKGMFHMTLILCS